MRIHLLGVVCIHHLGEAQVGSIRASQSRGGNARISDFGKAVHSRGMGIKKAEATNMAASATYQTILNPALFDCNQNCSDSHPVLVRIAGFIVAAAGDQCHPGQSLVFDDR